MYHSMQSSYNLCNQYALENNISYDLVVMIRPDIALSSQFDIEHYISMLSAEELSHAFLTISNNLAPINAGFKYLRAIDLLFFGKQNTISKIVNNTPSIIEELSKNRVINCPPEFKFIQSIIIGLKLMCIRKIIFEFVPP